MTKTSGKLTSEQLNELLATLETRFNNNLNRHPDMDWSKIIKKIETNVQAAHALYMMESTGGEPDVLHYEPTSDVYTFFDCSKESPSGRRSVCYDHDALMSRKQHKPAHSAVGMAKEMGIEFLDEKDYQFLQSKLIVDTKTSSWLLTPVDIREKGGALFGDWRFGRVFFYHNGAESYYGARGFRGLVKL